MRKSRLTKAVGAAVLAAGLSATAAQAAPVYNPHGVGDVLLYPYYSAENKYNTLFHLQNTDREHTVVAKVRLRDYKDSDDALDFTVILSPEDVFTGYIRLNPDDATKPQFVKADNTCTAPNAAAKSDVLEAENSTGYGQVGHIEVISMLALNLKKVDALDVSGNAVAAKHKKVLQRLTKGSLHSQTTSMPANCADVADLFGKDYTALNEAVNYFASRNLSSIVDVEPGQTTAIRNTLAGHYGLLNGNGYSGASRPVALENAVTGAGCSAADGRIVNPVDGGNYHLLTAQLSDHFYVPNLGNTNCIDVFNIKAVDTSAQEAALASAKSSLAVAKRNLALSQAKQTALAGAIARLKTALADETRTDGEFTSASTNAVTGLITTADANGDGTANDPLKNANGVDVGAAAIPVGAVNASGTAVNAADLNTTYDSALNAITAGPTALDTVTEAVTLSTLITEAKGALTVANAVVPVGNQLAPVNLYIANLTAIIAAMEANLVKLNAAPNPTAAETAADKALFDAATAVNAAAVNIPATTAPIFGRTGVALATTYVANTGVPAPANTAANSADGELLAVTTATQVDTATTSATAAAAADVTTKRTEVTAAENVVAAAEAALLAAGSASANALRFRELEYAIADGTPTVSNEWTARSTDDRQARTDLFVTLPLKHIYKDTTLLGTVTSKTTSADVFAGGDKNTTDKWKDVDSAVRGDNDELFDSAGCVNYNVMLTDREEGVKQSASVKPIVSGPQGASATKDKFCNETTVFTFNGGETTSSAAAAVDVSGLNQEFGTVTLNLLDEAGGADAAITSSAYAIRNFGNASVNFGQIIDSIRK